MAKKRYTVALLPSDEVAQALEAYARNHTFDQYINNKTDKDGNFVNLYRLGVEESTNPDNGEVTTEHRKAHITQVQFECEEEDFLRVIHFLQGQDFSNLETSFTGTNFFPVPKGNGAYPPVIDKDLKWIDRDVARHKSLMDLNRKLVAFLAELPSVDKNPDGTAKTVNGTLDNYRPHFTICKADLNDDDGVNPLAIPLPPFVGPENLKGLRVVVAESKLSGELTADRIWGEFDAKGTFTAKNGHDDKVKEAFAHFDSYRYKAWEYADWTYRKMPSMSAFYQSLPSMKDIRTKAYENFQYYTGRNESTPKPPKA